MTRTDARACRPIIPIPAALTQLAHAQLLHDSEPPHLLAFLASVPDPRAARGRRHPLVAILGLAAAAVLAGARSIATIAEWAPTRPSRSGPRSAPASRLLATAASRPRPPSAGRFRAWTPTCWPAPSAPGWPPGTGTVAAGGGRAVAVDGKTLRGARAADGPPVHLLACMDHASRTVLAQRQVGGAPEEVPVFQPLLDGLDLAGAVITADALQTRPQAAEFLVTRMHAHYLFTVKANQPTLLDRCQRLPWHRVPVLDCTRDRGHGRIELRTLKAVGTARRSWPACATWSSAPSAAPGRQPRRRPAPPRPRPTPTPHDPWDYPQVNRARPKNAQSAGCWGIGGGNSVAVDLGGVATVQL
jgi:hypothetical protein